MENEKTPLLLKVVYTLAVKLRRYLPNPELTARLFGTDVPIAYIKGRKTRLSRPESVVFSPSGDLMAISDSGSHTVTLFARDDTKECHYADAPLCVISDPVLLNYVHDAAFSPDGAFLATAAREAQTIAMYALHREDDKKVSADLLWSLTGEKSDINFPAGISFHPSGKLLAVANRMRNAITLFRGSGVDGDFDSRPFQMISDDDMSKYGLSAPHGFDFSPDGRYLAVAHKRFYKTKNAQGESGLSVYRMQDEPGEGVNPEPVCVVPYGNISVHLVAFNPAANLVAIIVSEFGVDLYRWDPEAQTLQKAADIFIFNGHIGEGPKGIAFTKDGMQVVLTTEFNEVLFFDLNTVLSSGRDRAQGRCT